MENPSTETLSGGKSPGCFRTITLDTFLKYGFPLVFAATLCPLLVLGQPFLHSYQTIPFLLAGGGFAISYAFLLFPERICCANIAKVIDVKPFIAAVSLIYGSLLYVCSLLISMEIDTDSTHKDGKCMQHQTTCVVFKESVEGYGTCYFAITCIVVILKDWDHIVTAMKRYATAPPPRHNDVTPSLSEGDQCQENSEANETTSLMNSNKCPQDNQVTDIVDIEIVTNDANVAAEITEAIAAERPSLMQPMAARGGAGGDDDNNNNMADIPPSGNVVAPMRTMFSKVPEPTATSSSRSSLSPSSGNTNGGRAEADDAPPGLPVPWWWVTEFVIIAFVGVFASSGLKTQSTNMTMKYGVWQAATALAVGIVGSQALLLPYTRAAMLKLAPKATLLFGATHTVLGMLRLLSRDGHISQCQIACQATSEHYDTVLWMYATMFYIVNLVVHYWSENRGTFSTVVPEKHARSMTYSQINLLEGAGNGVD